MMKKHLKVLNVDRTKNVVFRREVLDTTLTILDLFTEGSREKANVEILKEFAKRGPLSCPELVDIGYPEATVYRIVRKLKEKKILVPVAKYQSSRGGGPRATIYSILIRGQLA
jgi:hypothetical protein